MRIFVVLNSLIVFLTMGWPAFKKVYATISEIIAEQRGLSEEQY
jgi:hypothetical protein